MTPFRPGDDIPLAVLDLETTSPDPELARVVTAYAAVITRTGLQEHTERGWLVNPGIAIPPEATAIHGISDADAALGTRPGVFLGQLQEWLAGPAAGLPLVVYNAPYDLTVIDREARREWRGDPFRFPPVTVIDPLVLDKAVDRYRKGSRKLAATAEHYGVEVYREHDAKDDALLAGALAYRVLDAVAVKSGGDLALEQVHHWQTGWRRQQSESLADYWRTKGGGDPDSIRPEWPLIPYTPTGDQNA